MRTLLTLITLSLFTLNLQAQSCNDGSYQFSDILNIFQNKGCTNCHGSQGGLNLSNYNNVISGGNNGQGGCGSYGDPLSFLVGKIDGSLTASDMCGSAMPLGIGYGGSNMSNSELAAIQAWIDAGAPEFCPPSCNLTATATGINLTCIESGDGVIELIPSAGTAPYTYTWDNGFNTGSGTGTTIGGLEAGSYIIVLIDVNNCAFTLAYTLTEPTPVEGFTVVTDASCSNDDGAIELTATGGIPPYTYSWNNGATTQNISNLPSGFYSVNITDANACIGFGFANVEQDCDPCPETLNVDNSPIPSGLYFGVTLLSSTGTVAPGSSVGFISEQTIFLDNDFSVEPQANFSAEIGPCLDLPVGNEN